MACKYTISNFLHEKSVLIIGAKDSLCETLTRKILNYCNVWNIYIVFHQDPENDKSNLKIPCFENEANKEILVMNGDLSQNNLGLNSDQIALLRENVSAVYYIGITDYKATLETAIKINLTGTCQVLNVCHQIKGLQALIYVSTVFSCTGEAFLDEIFYPQPISPTILMEYSNWMDNQQLQHVMKQFDVCLNGFVLTKNLSETLMDNEMNEFPIAILRPSIVLELSDGLMRIQKNLAVLNDEVPFELEKTSSVNLVSVNNLANLLLSASWYIIVHRPKIPVIYHCTGNLNPTVKFKKVGGLHNYSKKCIKLITDWLKLNHSMIDSGTLYRPFLKESFSYGDNNRIQLKKLMNEEDKAILSTDEKAINYKYNQGKTESLNYLLLLEKYNILFKILLLFFWKKYILKSTPAINLLFTSAAVLLGLTKACSKGFKYIRRHY